MLDFWETGRQLAQATESTARALMPYSGKGDKHEADGVAVRTLRESLNSLNLKLRIVIGEGEKDRAPMLYSGEQLGVPADRTGEDGVLDLVVDPLECTGNFARGLSDSLCVLTASPANSVQAVPGTYMEQLLLPPPVTPLLGKEIDLDVPVEKVLKLTADSLGRSLRDITIVVQDRPRHERLIADIRKVGAGVSLIPSGSISAALKIMLGSSKRLTMMWGIFGAPEGLVLALLANCSRYGFLGRIHPHDEKSREETKALGLAGKTLTGTEWITGRGVVVISGVHTSIVLPGVEYVPSGPSLRVHTLLWTNDVRRVVTHLDGKEESIRDL